MNKSQVKNILIVFLLSITAFSIFKFTSSLKEQFNLSNRLNKAKDEILVLEKERQDLLQEIEKERDTSCQLRERNSKLKDYLKANKRMISDLFADLKERTQTIEELNSKSCLLKLEVEALQQKKEQLSQENESFKAKLSSVTELKKAIKEIKMQARKMHIEMKKQAAVDKIIEGNRGYLIKAGKATYPVKLKIEVILTPK
jgi:chromosome segregation ATPase